VPDSSQIIGLDIDDKSVKFVKLKATNNDVMLVKYAVAEIPPSPEKVKSVAEILKGMFKGERSDTAVYLCSFGQNVSLKRITLPNMPDAEIGEAIKWEAKNISPFPIEGAAIDFYKITQAGKTAEKVDLMFAVAGAELMTFINALSKEANIKFSGLSAVPFALSSVLEKNEKIEPGKVFAVIDIGAEAASINLFKGNVLQFTREITVAGDSFTKAMTGLLVADHWQLNLTYEQAEEIKKGHGIPKKDSEEITEAGIPLVHIYEMMAPTLRRLQNEIIRSFDYYKEQFREEKIDNIFLTGGSAGLKNLEEHLANSLGIKVESINPFEKIKIDPKSGIKEEELVSLSSRLCLAVGLALEKGKKINFLKSKDKKGFTTGLEGVDFSKIKKALHLPDDMRVFTSAGIWMLAILIAGGIYYNMRLTGIRNKLRAELDTKRNVLYDVKSLVERRSVLDAIIRQESRMREILFNINQVLPEGVTLLNMRFNNAQMSIDINGIADNQERVGKLIQDIEASSKFDNTVLFESRKTVVEGQTKAAFRISFHISSI
jgi:type IV pilus assembly protein PilM